MMIVQMWLKLWRSIWVRSIAECGSNMDQIGAMFKVVQIKWTWLVQAWLNWCDRFLRFNLQLMNSTLTTRSWWMKGPMRCRLMLKCRPQVDQRVDQCVAQWLNVQMMIDSRIDSIQKNFSWRENVVHVRPQVKFSEKEVLTICLCCLVWALM